MRIKNGQVVVNYASSAGAAEDVAQQIRAAGGEAIVVGADLAKQEDIERCAGCSRHCPVLVLRFNGSWLWSISPCSPCTPQLLTRSSTAN